MTIHTLLSSPLGEFEVAIGEVAQVVLDMMGCCSKRFSWKELLKLFLEVCPFPLVAYPVENQAEIRPFSERV